MRISLAVNHESPPDLLFQTESGQPKKEAVFEIPREHHPDSERDIQMFRPPSIFRSRVKSANRLPKRHVRTRLNFEALEDRAVPTIVFPASAYGAETAVDGGGEKISNPVIQLVFWGSYWKTEQGKLDKDRDDALATDLSFSTYFAGLKQYIGSTPGFGFMSPDALDYSSAPTGSTSDSTLANDVDTEVLQDILKGAVGEPGALPSPTQYGGFTPIYVVVTPPGAIDDLGGGNLAQGWNTDYVSGDLDLHIIWCFDPSSDDHFGGTPNDQFSVVLGHELTEIMTDPTEDGSGVTVQAAEPGDGVPQICDGEPQVLSYRLGGPGGYLVQSFWSQQDQAYIIPDGNSYQFQVTGGSHGYFNEGTGSTLTINGGQAGAGTADTIAVSDSGGAVSATLDGQTVSFDAGAVTHVIVNASTAGTKVNVNGTWGAGTSLTVNAGSDQTKVNIGGTWGTGANALVEAKGSDTVNVNGTWNYGSGLGIQASNNPVTIDVCPDDQAITGNFAEPIFVDDYYHVTQLTLDNQSVQAPQTWGLNSNYFLLDSSPVVIYGDGAPSQVTVNTGTGSDTVNVESTLAATDVNFGGTGNVVTFAANEEDLAAIEGAVNLNGAMSSLSFDDQKDAAAVSVTLDSGVVRQGNMAPVYYPGPGSVGSLSYSAGTANDRITTTPVYQNMEDLPALVSITGGPGQDTLTIDDAAHTAAYETSNLYSVDLAGEGVGQIGRSYVVSYGGVTEDKSFAVDYSDISGGATLDADNLGTPVDVEATTASAPTTVDLGTGNTMVTVSPFFHTLQTLGSTLTLDGGTGIDSLVVNDQADLYTSPAPYMVNSDLILRTFLASPYAAGVVYHGFSGGVTLNTDDNGSPVNIEATSVPTTVNLGTDNTNVSVTSEGKSIGTLANGLSVSGGGGIDTLTINDALHPASTSSLGGTVTPISYTVTGQSVELTSYFSSRLLHVKSTLSIDYAGMTGGVTLDTDDNGTPVNIEGTSVPTMVNVGSGNTAISVAATGKNLASVAGGLSINGGNGIDTLTVNDSLHPASTSTGGGTVTPLSYTVTGQGVALTSYFHSRFFNTSSTLTIAYAKMTGGLTLDTDNVGTPVNIEGTSVPTTVNVGSGDTAVSVTSAGQNIGMLATGLTVNGGGAIDTLTVNDALHPASTPIAGGTVTLIGYTVTGQSVELTTYFSSRFLHTRSTETIAYANMTGGVTLDTDNVGTPVDIENTSVPTTVNVGSGNTAVSVAASGENLASVAGGLSINGGGGIDTLTLNDALHPASTSSGGGVSTPLSYTVSGQSVAETSYFSSRFFHTSSTLTIAYANFTGGVTLDTDNVGTPVYVSGSPGPDTVTVVGGTGTNKLYGPAVATSWSLTGANAGTLGGWLSFQEFASLVGGSAANSFDFAKGASLSGSIAGGAGPNLLNYARDSGAVTVNLATGVATGVAGGVSNIQGVVGDASSDVLTAGSGRAVLIGGGGAATLNGGSTDSLLIGGGTTYDLNDVALEAILAEWDRTDRTFSQRVNDLSKGGGLNGSNVLTASTVTEDSQANTLSSGTGQTWFVAHAKDHVHSTSKANQTSIVP